MVLIQLIQKIISKDFKNPAIFQSQGFSVS